MGNKTVCLTPEGVERFVGRLGNSQGEPLRQSRQRQRYLNKLSRMITPREHEVEMNIGNGCFSQEPRPDEFYIEITGDSVPQPVTGIRQEVWDLLFQETVLFHEIGHVLFSDFSSFKTMKTKASSHGPRGDNKFKELFNAMEDGCIELYLSQEFSIRQDLVVMNENLVHRIREQKTHYTASEAVAAGLQDHGFYDSGRWSEDILTRDVDVDEWERVVALGPRIREVAEECVRSGRGSQRVEIIYDFFEECISHFDDFLCESQRDENTRQMETWENHDQSSGDQKLEPMMPPEESEEEKSEEQKKDGEQGSEEQEESQQKTEEEEEREPEEESEEGEGESEEQEKTEDDLSRVREIIESNDPEDLKVVI